MFAAAGAPSDTIQSGRPGGPRSREDDPRTESRKRLLRRWPLLLLLGWVAQVALRLWLSAGRAIPVATPDETGYLFAARVLAGGAPADMSAGTVYRGGYPLLLLPVTWASQDPVTVYQASLVVNALISAAMLPAAYLLLRRLALTRGMSYTFGHVTALLPGVVFYTEFVLTDAVLPVVTMVWLLLTHSWLTADPSTSRRRVAVCGAAAAALAAYGYVTHARGVILLVVHAGVLAIAALRGWRSRTGIAVVAAVMAAVVGAGVLLNHSLLPLLYPQGDNDLSGNLLLRLTTVDGYAWTLSLAAGQLWYQVVASAGLAGIGLVTLTVVALRRGTDGRLRVLAGAVLMTVLGVALVTSAALPVEYRVGNYAYGRYLAFITPILFTVGLAVLVRGGSRTVIRATAASAALCVVTAGVVQWYAGDLLSRYTYTLFDFPEVSAITLNWTEFRLWHATLAGLAMLCLVVLVARPRHGPVVLAGLLAVANVAIVTTATMRISRPLARELTAVSDLRGVVDLRDRPAIAIDWNVPWTIRVSHYYWAWTGEGGMFDARRTPPPRDADMVVLSWPKGVPATATWRDAPAGWRVVRARRTEEGDWVAWHRPPTGR